MVRVLESRSAGRVWSSLLEFRRFLATPRALERDEVGFALDPAQGWRFEEDARATRQLRVPLGAQSTPELGADVTHFSFARFLAGEEPLVTSAGFPDPDVLDAYRIYLPLLLGDLEARRSGRPFVTAHLAQTLDGRIACLNGHSKWISNEANLHHAHRLRALHDAVIVGARTVQYDDPQLTVRHVEGADPSRVILSAGGSVLGGRAHRVFEGAGGTVLCRTETLGRLGGEADAAEVGVELLGVEAGGDIPPAAICAALAQRGIHSAFLEGGAQTVSAFLAAGRIDVLHVHMAPLILGSGISSIQLPEVTSVQQGKRMHVEHFELEGELLVECREVKGPA